MRSCKVLLILFSFIFLAVHGAYAMPPANPKDALQPQITAESAILVEATTGRVLYEKNADRLMYPASMTKIMTCLLALEQVNQSAPVVVSYDAAATDYAEVEAGNILTMKELETEMMLESDNGAAVAIAEYMAPSVTRFTEMMTERAARLGATHTRFANPNGLPDPSHVSTARDMMKIARFAWQIPAFRQIVGQKTHQVRFLSGSGESWEADNTNRLLGEYPGMVGIKTGWTEAAGGCLAGACTRNGVTLISIVMNSIDGASRFSDTAALMDYGFPRVHLSRGEAKERIERTLWVHDGTTYKVTAHPRTDVEYLLFDNESVRRCSYTFDMPRFINAPVKQGDKVGDLVLLYDGQEMGRIDMVADTSMEKGFSLIAHVIDFYDKILGPFLA